MLWDVSTLTNQCHCVQKSEGIQHHNIVMFCATNTTVMEIKTHILSWKAT